MALLIWGPQEALEELQDSPKNFKNKTKHPCLKEAALESYGVLEPNFMARCTFRGSLEFRLAPDIKGVSH